MIEKIKTFLESLKTKRHPILTESATKQAIILPLITLLGWDTTNIDEVSPEYSVENGRVDYSLRIKKENRVFIEAKKLGDDLENCQEQLLEYSFREGVEIAILTNGITWWWYLPTKKGDWKARKFYTIDIDQQDSSDVTQKFSDLLSKDNVSIGKAYENAESIYKGKLKKKALEETLPEAWNKLISEPDLSLRDLLSETTEKLCGFKPEDNEVARFLKLYENQFRLLPQEEIPFKKSKDQKESARPRPSVTPSQGTEKISQEDLIPVIVKVLQEKGGRASKDEVEKKIYQMFKDTFKDAWYRETMSHGIPRWKHNIAWAKEMAKHKGLIKRPADSGRGYWELTEKGKPYKSEQ